MDILLVSSREADLAYMEATNEIAMAMNCSDISDFMEDADSAKKSNGVSSMQSETSLRKSKHSSQICFLDLMKCVRKQTQY